LGDDPALNGPSMPVQGPLHQADVAEVPAER
jgi:hypothetical protein